MYKKLLLSVLAVTLQGVTVKAQLYLGESLVEIQKAHPGGELELSSEGGYTYSVIDTSILTFCVFTIDASMNSKGVLFIPANKEVYKVWRGLLNDSGDWKHSERKKWISRWSDGTLVQCEQITPPGKDLPDAFQFSVLK